MNNILDYGGLILFSFFIFTGGEYMTILYISLILFLYYFLREHKNRLVNLIYIIILIGLAIIFTEFLEKEWKIICIILGSIFLIFFFRKRYKDGKNIWY